MIKTLTNHSSDILANTGPGYFANGWKDDRWYKPIDEINIVWNMAYVRRNGPRMDDAPDATAGVINRRNELYRTGIIECG